MTKKDRKLAFNIYLFLAALFITSLVVSNLIFQKFVSQEIVKKNWNDFKNKNSVLFSHPLSMLLTLSLKMNTIDEAKEN